VIATPTSRLSANQERSITPAPTSPDDQVACTSQPEPTDQQPASTLASSASTHSETVVPQLVMSPKFQGTAKKTSVSPRTLERRAQPTSQQDFERAMLNDPQKYADDETVDMSNSVPHLITAVY
jgi:hypothetical protein